MKLYEKQKALAEHEASDQVCPEQLENMRVEIRAAVALANSRPTSTARRVARFHWWTVEYGLIGPEHLIYGGWAAVFCGRGEAIQRCTPYQVIRRLL